MKDFFEPRKLNVAVSEIRKKHPSRSTPPEFKSDQDFAKMVKRWAYMAEEDVAQEAMLIPPRRIKQLVEYMSGNVLNVPLHNLRSIIRLRATEEIFRRLFSLWYDAYDSPDFNTLLYYIMQDYPEYPAAVFQNSKLTSPIFLQWLKSEDIPVAVGKSCIRLKKQMHTFEDAMLALKVSPESVLGKACIDSFYTYCGKDDYFQVSDKELDRIVRRYSLKQIHLFLRNILTVLDVPAFQRFYLTGRYLQWTYTDSSGTKKYQLFFANYPPDLVTKYRHWLDYIVVRDSFSKNPNDPRLIFWSRYVPHSEGAYIEKTSESFIMKFERYCILEFTEKTMGPIYIFEKSTFEKQVQPQTRFQSNTDLRSYLLHRSPYVARVEHRGNWQWKVEQYLMMNRITR